MAENELQQAIGLVQTGKRNEAVPILKNILKTDRNNELAWLWLSTCVDKTEDKIYCFQEALRINPTNEQVKKEIALLEPYPFQSKPQYSPPAVPQSSTFAVISLVLGIVSFVLLPFLGGIGAIITGAIAKEEINKSQGRKNGSGMATAGLVLGWINVVLTGIPLCFIILILLGPVIGHVFSNVVTVTPQ